MTGYINDIGGLLEVSNADCRGKLKMDGSLSGSGRGCLFSVLIVKKR